MTGTGVKANREELEQLYPDEVLPPPCPNCGGLLTPATAASHVLRISLEFAVPMHIHDVAGFSPDYRMIIASECATIVGSHGDALQFGGKQAAECFNALARGLAIAAYQPGGVAFAGLHWCVPDEQQTVRLPPPPPPREVVTATVAGGVL